MNVHQLMGQQIGSPSMVVKMEPSISSGSPSLKFIQLRTVGKHRGSSHMVGETPGNVGQPMKNLQHQLQTGLGGTVHCFHEALDAPPDLNAFVFESVLCRVEKVGQLRVILQQV